GTSRCRPWSCRRRSTAAAPERARRIEEQSSMAEQKDAVPAGLRYSREHEWVNAEGSAAGTVTVGITHHAQDELGDIVFVDLPEPGRMAEAGASFGSVESVKAVSEIYSP